mmetsp:Transcript_1636/g.7152  ORF Transcript_1636/g.7152 Transcript_1636/m.7152 type:complete len:207 (-) Transcript_1636:345-965(-)
MFSFGSRRKSFNAPSPPDPAPRASSTPRSNRWLAASMLSAIFSRVACWRHSSLPEKRHSFDCSQAMFSPAQSSGSRCNMSNACPSCSSVASTPDSVSMWSHTSRKLSQSPVSCSSSRIGLYVRSLMVTFRADIRCTTPKASMGFPICAQARTKKMKLGSCGAWPDSTMSLKIFLPMSTSSGELHRFKSAWYSLVFSFVCAGKTWQL